MISRHWKKNTRVPSDSSGLNTVQCSVSVTLGRRSVSCTFGWKFLSKCQNTLVTVLKKNLFFHERFVCYRWTVCAICGDNFFFDFVLNFQILIFFLNRKRRLLYDTQTDMCATGWKLRIECDDGLESRRVFLTVYSFSNQCRCQASRRTRVYGFFFLICRYTDIRYG